MKTDEIVLFSVLPLESEFSFVDPVQQQPYGDVWRKISEGLSSPVRSRLVPRDKSGHIGMLQDEPVWVRKLP